MVNEWDLRVEILTASHRWSVILLFILVGSLIGAAVSYLIPAPYRAETSLFVAYNADVYARNPDDYKNWQMEQLNVLILSDEVLQETLERLKTQNPTWSTTSLQELKDMLHVYWRNAGEWRLVSEVSPPELANELVNTWKSVILEQIDQAKAHATTVLKLSTRIDNISNSLLDNQQRTLQLNEIKQGLQSWMQSVDESNSAQPLPATQRWFLLSSISSAAGWNPEGKALLVDTPPPQAAAADYIPWLEKVLVFIDQELASLEPQSSQLSAEYDQLYGLWSEELDASRGLTAYILVEAIDGDPLPAQPVRSTSLMAFVGGMLGLLVWALIWLAKPIRQVRAQTS